MKLIAASILVALFVYFGGLCAVKIVNAIINKQDVEIWPLYVCAICAGLVWYLF